MPTADQLRAIMSRYRLSCGDVAQLLGVTPRTVKAWRYDPESRGHRTMPAPMLRLLKLELVLKLRQLPN